jgi:tRNA A-37 threonylcarbamoyl transferase component Bud32
MAPSSLEGQMLGRYRVLEPLGRGGMARVYRAYHPQLDRYVAIKVLRSDLVEEEEFLARFQREAQAVAALRHPNIVQVYDFDVQDDVYYMVMELLEGDTLKVRLNDYRLRDEKMPRGEVVRITLDVLDGLAYAHSEEMIHRDIKPANVLLSRRGQAVIGDFGIAQIVGGTRHTASGALMGTLNYMAPEQGLKGHCDARSDIYSLGIVLYEMLTRRTPFEADTPLAVLMKHLNEPLPLPRQVDPEIPEPFERVVLKALAKEPDDRFQSADEMVQALREAAEKAEIALPDRVSLPLSFKTAEAPSESVAVLSGTARQKIADAQFAVDDTDTSLSQRLAAGREAAEPVEEEQARSGVGKELLNTIGVFGRLVMSQTARALRKELLNAIGMFGRLVMSQTARALRDAAEVAAGGSPEAPSPPGAVAPGGTSREMPDGPSAVGQTGAPLGQQPGTEHATRKRLRAARKGKRATRKTALQLPTVSDEPGVPSGRKERTRAILGAIGLVSGLGVVLNLTAVWIASLTGWWAIFEKGWPMELFLVGLGLCMIMVNTETIWTLIPVGVVLGNGVLFSYYALTGNWRHWVFLWPLEPIIIICTVFLTIWLVGLGDLSRRLSRALGWVLGFMAATWSVILPLAALIMPR